MIEKNIMNSSIIETYAHVQRSIMFITVLDESVI